MSTQAVSHMDFTVVEALAGFYDTRTWMERIENSWILLVTSPHARDPESERQWLGSLLYLTESYLEVEGALAAKAEAALKDLPSE